jgi:hypothetical protein
VQFSASSRKSAALRGGVLLYAAQAMPPIDAEIAEKGHLWTETSSLGDCHDNQGFELKRIARHL